MVRVRSWRNIAIALIVCGPTSASTNYQRLDWIHMKNDVQFICCFCRKAVSPDDLDSYTLQVRKRGSTSPVALWSHGVCLRETIPVMAEETPAG